MKGLFSYENKFIQFLVTVGDFFILNFLYLLCCLPIVTIGAAQAGLCTGLRKLTDKEDDTSPVAAFMRGFSNGFTKITPAFLIMLILILFTGYTAASVAFFDVNGMKGAPVVLSLISVCICALFQTMISVFHSRFSCTVWQLFRNAWLLFLAHPLRAILIAVLAWSPLLLFLGDPRIFVLLTPVFFTLYFSLTFLLINKVMKKPFDDVIKIFSEKQEQAETTE